MMTLGRNIDLSDWAGPGDALPEGPALYLEVADTGEGMNEKILTRVFEPFFSTRFAGRGLGLSAVLGIMHGHGGSVFILSHPGEGTRVRAVFPLPGGPDEDK